MRKLLCLVLLTISVVVVKAGDTDSLSQSFSIERSNDSGVDISEDLSNESIPGIEHENKESFLTSIVDAVTSFMHGVFITINGIIYITGLGTILWFVIRLFRKTASARRKKDVAVPPSGQETLPNGRDGVPDKTTQPEKKETEKPDEHKAEEEEKKDVIKDPEPPKPVKPEKEAHVAAKFLVNEGSWMILGASVQGKGHISSNTPCQDFCAHESLGRGWGIAIVSDGAGSAKHANTGSQITATRSLHHMKKIVEREGWIDKMELPSDACWTQLAYSGLKSVRDDIYQFAKQNNIEANTLNATAIVVIYSPIGLLVAHVGDGRAGYRNAQGKWTAMITPHKGEEANQTIFIPSNFWDIPFFSMSDVLVPEARVIREKATAFTLMSDGCEHTTWICNRLNDLTGKYHDPNVPYERFFDPVVEQMRRFKNDESSEETLESWGSFIKEHPGFNRETDDKTLLVGILEEE